MATFKLLYEGLPELLPMTGRSEGIHVSTVVNDICIRLGHYTGDSDTDQSRLELGCALEHAIADRFNQQWPNRYIRLGELELDNIFMTPDLYDIDDDDIVEIKLTWMTSNQPVDGTGFWKYWVQIKSYCKGAKTTTGKLIVCHVNGDSREFKVVARVWRGIWSQQEIDENWRLIKTHADRLRRQSPILTIPENLVFE